MDYYKQVTEKLPEQLNLRPSRWVHSYEEFIAKNASAVTQIESALRSLTYVIPGRFRQSELATESLHSGVQLLSLYHDELLTKASSRLSFAQRLRHQSRVQQHPSPHNRYTTFWTQKSSAYRRLSVLLQTIRYTELLWEMTAKRRGGDRARWRVVVLLEILKAFCRLLLLRITNSRPLVTPPLPEREFDPAALEESRAAETSDMEGSGASSRLERLSQEVEGDEMGPMNGSEPWIMPRTKLSLPALPDASDISNYLLSRVLKADDVKPPKSLLRPIAGKAEIAEWLYILRPVIYALAMQRWASKDRKSWRPWLLGLGIEYGARQLAKKDFQQTVAGGLRGLTGLERDELRKRGWNMGWWMMKGAFYENVTKPWIASVTGKLHGKPLLGFVGDVVEDYQYLWDEYYFSTSTF